MRIRDSAPLIQQKLWLTGTFFIPLNRKCFWPCRIPSPSIGNLRLVLCFFLDSEQLSTAEFLLREARNHNTADFIIQYESVYSSIHAQPTNKLSNTTVHNECAFSSTSRPTSAPSSGIPGSSQRTHNPPHPESSHCACALHVEWVSWQLKTGLPARLRNREKWFQQTTDHIHHVSHRFPRKPFAIPLSLNAIWARDHRWWEQWTHREIDIGYPVFGNITSHSCYAIYLLSEMNLPAQHSHFVQSGNAKD